MLVFISFLMLNMCHVFLAHMVYYCKFFLNTYLDKSLYIPSKFNDKGDKTTIYQQIENWNSTQNFFLFEKYQAKWKKSRARTLLIVLYFFVYRVFEKMYISVFVSLQIFKNKINFNMLLNSKISFCCPVTAYS